MENNTNKYSYIRGGETNEELFMHLLESNQPWREESVAELHARGLSVEEIEAGIREARKKMDYPSESIAQEEIERGINVTRDFFRGLTQ